MRQSKCILFLMVLGLLLPSCGLLKKKQKPAPTAPKNALIGIVEMVNPEQSYVLIRCDQTSMLPAGTELVVVDPAGEESSVRLTPERKGRYLTADIHSGQPKLGSFVVHRTNVEAPLPTPLTPGTLPGSPEGAPLPLDPLASSPPSLLQPATSTLPTLPSIDIDSLPRAPTIDPAPVSELEPPVQ
jgi:hypothetical protein